MVVISHRYTIAIVYSYSYYTNISSLVYHKYIIVIPCYTKVIYIYIYHSHIILSELDLCYPPGDHKKRSGSFHRNIRNIRFKRFFPHYKPSILGYPPFQEPI